MNGFDVEASDEGVIAVPSYVNGVSRAVETYREIYSPRFNEHQGTPVESWRYNYVKRILDASMALVLMMAFAIPGLLIALAIALTSEGSVFYREVRIGRNRRPFRIWKFRSMHGHNSRARSRVREQEIGVELSYRTKKTQHDPRVTVVGRFLRRWSLDEIPQIINVLRGEMSLIGPRPIVEAETHFYSDLLPFYLAATPGLSGLWQVSGRSDVDYPRRAELDACYVMDWTLRKDIEILMRTIPAVLAKTGAR